MKNKSTNELDKNIVIYKHVSEKKLFMKLPFCEHL